VIGMLFANIVARNRGLLSAEIGDFLSHNLLLNSFVSSVKPSDIDTGPIMEAMGKDKKRVGKDLVIVLMKDDFSFTKVTDFKPKELITALEELRVLLRNR